MPIALHQLPDDVDALKSLIADQLARNAQLSSENQRYRNQVLTLTEQLNLALARRYAASSEKLSPDQICLFDEAEADALADAVIDDDSNADEEVTVAAHRRKKRGRKPLPDHLPRVDVIHELAEDERRYRIGRP
jgi:hypothetical protein